MEKEKTTYIQGSVKQLTAFLRLQYKALTHSMCGVLYISVNVNSWQSFNEGNLSVQHFTLHCLTPCNILPHIGLIKVRLLVYISRIHSRSIAVGDDNFGSYPISPDRVYVSGSSTVFSTMDDLCSVNYITNMHVLLTSIYPIF